MLYLFNSLTPFLGPLSFWADYLNMTNESIAHVIDRTLAVFMFLAFLWRIMSLFCFARPSNFILQLAAFSFAMFCFMNGQDAQEAYDIEGWKFWHNLWHCFPFIVAAIEVHDRYVLGEYDCDVKQSSCMVWWGRIYSTLLTNVKSSLLVSTETELSCRISDEDSVSKKER